MGETVTTAPRTSPSTSTGSAITSGAPFQGICSGGGSDRRPARAASSRSRAIASSGAAGDDGANGVPSAVTTYTDTPYTCR